MWTKKEDLKGEKIFKVKEILVKDKVLKDELNINLKIKLTNIKKQNSYLSYLNNNYGRSAYDGALKSISRFKFSKIERFHQYDPEISIDKKNIIFFDNKGSIIKFDEKSKLIWKKNIYSKSEKKTKSNSILC